MASPMAGMGGSELAPGDTPVAFFSMHEAATVDAIASEPPDLIALSHYCWNANLDLAVLREARRIQPTLQTVLAAQDRVPAGKTR